MKRTWLNTILLVLATSYCTAQTDGYKHYTRLDSVKNPGFYNIALSPATTPYLKTDHSDLRIINQSGRWVPHILQNPATEPGNRDQSWHLVFSTVENSPANTVLIIEKGSERYPNFGLLITNTAAERFGTLSGSNDQKQWYVINDSILLNPVPAQDATENIFTIHYPRNNYQYLKLVIHNKNKNPFNIQGVVQWGLLTGSTDPMYALNENPPPVLQQKDSGKVSYLKIVQPLPYHVDHIRLQVSGVKYYNRKAALYIPYSSTHSLTNPGELVASFTISNNSALEFKLPLAKAAGFYLFIYNEDNLPLRVDSVRTFSYNRYITAYLDSSNQYSLIMNNAAAVPPNYDLPGYMDTLPANIPQLHFSNIVATAGSPLPTPRRNNSWILWVAIGAALLVLIFFTFKMLKEVEKRKQHDHI